MINYYGQEVTKPEGFSPTPTIEYSIVPAQRVPFDLWGEIVRAELKSSALGKHSGIEDCILVKKLYL